MWANCMTSIYVIAVDASTGERAKITVCNPNTVKFYEEQYKAEGYKVETYTSEEVDEILERENKGKKAR